MRVVSAATALIAAGKNVLVLEARNRVGGRAFSDNSFATPVRPGRRMVSLRDPSKRRKPWTDHERAPRLSTKRTDPTLSERTDTRPH